MTLMEKAPDELKSEKALTLWNRIQAGHFVDYVAVNGQITRLHIFGSEAVFLRELARAKLPGRKHRPGSSST